MTSLHRVRSYQWGLLVALTALLCSQTASAQTVNRGFVIDSSARATGMELAAQPEFWMMEIKMKPMRMMAVELTDPRTGEKKRELVWYLVYQAIRRPQEKPAVNEELIPQNDAEPEPGPPLFVPEFVLVGNDDNTTKVYYDEVLPEAQAAIQKRERTTLKNSVEAIGPVPPAPTDGAAEPPAIFGVATWRGIDPQTDYFTVYLTGFSNGYKLGKDPDGKPLMLRKTLVQKYWRPGDEIDQSEIEFKPVEEPQWIYRAEEVAETTSAPQ